MQSPSDVAAGRESIDRQAKERWHKYAGERIAKIKAVETEGVLGAAGAVHAARRMAHTSIAEGRVFEAIVGGDDTDLINFLTRGWRAGRSVGRVVFGSTPIGTAFLIAPGLLISNAHVLPTASDIAGFAIEFDFERDADDKPLTSVRFMLEPERLFVASPQERLDFAIVGVAPVGSDGSSLDRFGWLPLDERTDKILEGEPVVVIQHPLGREKRVCLFNSELVFRAPDSFLQYTTDTELGSSGSPAFNRQWQVVGLHHASVPSDTTDKGARVMINEGVRVSAVVAALRANADLGGALIGDGTAVALAAIDDPRTLGEGRPNAPVSLVSPTGDVELEAAATVIRRRDIAHYDGRTGYDPAFLGVDVPLPTVPTFLQADIAPVTGADDAVLRYEHYSVVMSMTRRLPYFAAVNLDGDTLDPLNDPLHKSLSRTDRDPDRFATPESAADVWYYDPRIAEAYQLTPLIYDETPFDFGHMVRRLDPVWGDARTKRVGNDDSFHMTNCAPQHQDLNRKIWSDLEDAAYNAAQKNGVRVSIISGPVLDPRDPPVLGVPTPTAYWKIVAWTENGDLVARGFLQWQVQLVADVARTTLEALPQLVKAEVWRRPIADIARLTGLDFGPLLAADDSPAGGTPLVDDTGALVFP